MIDVCQKGARESHVKIAVGRGKKESIKVTWKPHHKVIVAEYADKKGVSFSSLCEEILVNHVKKVARKRKWKDLDDVKKILKKIKGTLDLTEYIRWQILEYIDLNPLRSLPPAPKQDDLEKIKNTRPEALVYVIPVNCSRIVAATDGEGGWRGLVFDPAIIGSVSTWHSSHLNPPVWAKTPTVLRSLAFVASRIDMDGLCYFEIPQTSIKVSAKWDPGSKRFESGEVIDLKSGHRQGWQRGGWYSAMPDPKGPFNMRPNVRRALNMLCRTMTVGDGGLTTNVPSH